MKVYNMNLTALMVYNDSSLCNHHCYIIILKNAKIKPVRRLTRLILLAGKYIVSRKS